MFGWFRRKRAPEDWRIAAQWAARARWISHLCDFLGDPSDQFSARPGLELPYRPDFLVVEFPPRPERPYFSYVTAGVSFLPQPPGGPMPHLELVACSEARDPRVATMLFVLSRDIVLGEPGDPPFKAFDLWRAELHGLRDFMLAPAREPDGLLDFPNVARRPEDERYLLACTGELRGELALHLLQLIPLTPSEHAAASAGGSRALLAELEARDAPKFHGWSALDGAR